MPLFGAAFQNDVIFHDTIYENIRFGRDVSKKEAMAAAQDAQAVEFIEEKGLDAMLAIRGMDLSGGQKQRAAAARALITNPKLILADEPTGALDSKASDELLSLFSEINRTGQTIVMVTHSVKAASTAGRVLFIRDGEVFHQIYRGNDTDEQLYQKISDTLTLLATGGDRR